MRWDETIMRRANAIPSASFSTATRRGAIGLIGGGLLAGRLRPAMAAAPRDLAFDIYRKGEKVGEHEVRFASSSGGLRVTSRAELTVKVAFITAYRYEQLADDEWREDVLVRTRITTDDDGEKFLVTAEAQNGKLLVSGPTGGYALPLGIMTDISFWNLAITEQPRLIDSQSAELVPVRVKPDAIEAITVRGRTIQARRFAMTASRGRSGTTWYDEDGNLVKALVLTRGERLDYQLAA
jgi:hypothetical protein